MTQQIFNVNDEIDKIIDKFSNDLKIKIKKLMIKNDKNVLKTYINEKDSKKSNNRPQSSPTRTRKKSGDSKIQSLTKSNIDSDDSE